jgi:uncharacterized repeat protein (TIGR02543 family)
MLVRDLNKLNYNYIFIKSANTNAYIIIPISVLPEFAYDRTSGVIDFGSKYGLYQYSLSNIISPGTWNTVNTQTLDLSNMDYKYIFISYNQSSDKYIMIELTKVEKTVDDTTYTVTYNANGGNAAPGEQSFKSNEAITISSVIPYRTGYTFLGWNTDPNAIVAKYVPGENVFFTNTETLYAVWKMESLSEVDTIIITYDVNGGDDAPSAETFLLGEEIRISVTWPTRADYRFLGWSKSSTATIGEYNPYQKVSFTESVTLYAVWKIEREDLYTLTYDANGGVGAPNSQTFIPGWCLGYETNGGQLTLSPQRPTREGYKFLGWGYDNNSTSAYYIPGEKVEFSGSLTLYAIWMSEREDENKSWRCALQYYFYEDKNIPYCYTNEITFTPGEELTLNFPSKTKDGYIFSGWNTIETATTAEYIPGDKVIFYESTILYAIWEKE